VSTRNRTDDLHCELEQRGFTSVLHVAGPLDVHTSPALRTAFLKCLADEPDLVVIDLAGVKIVEEIALSVLPALARHAATWPGSAVALAADEPRVVNALDRMAVCHNLPLYPSLGAAIARTESDGAQRRLRRRLPAMLSSTSEARELVNRVCVQWGLYSLTDVAQLIITELVSNVIRHAHTDMDVSVALRHRYLHLAVRDGSTEQPRRGGANESLREEGRGLLVVEALTAAWGFAPAPDGKVVWATLHVPRDGAR
jgi:anti-anti-sigma factor